MAEPAPMDGDAIRRLAMTRIERRLGRVNGMAKSDAFLMRYLVYASASPALRRALSFSPSLLETMGQALTADCVILTDSAMTKAGIQQQLLPRGVKVLCFLDKVSAEEAKRRATTRSALAVLRHWRPLLGRAVIAIGNAPTALTSLMTLLEEGADMPRAIAAFPLGFVGAADAKRRFVRLYGDRIAHVVLRGQKGGSSLAAASVNAALRWRLRDA